MARRTWAVAALIALAGGGALAAARGGPAADRRAIAEGEKAWGGAFVTGDAATVDRLLAEDFLGVDSSGRTYGKAEAMKDVRDGPRLTSDKTEPPTIRLYGDTAIAQAREHEIGPAPEFKPMERVFTDTWVKRGGRWRIVAAEDLDPGAYNTPAQAADEAAIRATRAASNRAIAAHDLAAFTPAFADDAVFVWSNGTSAIGKAGLETFFARDFADPAFDRYVRTPERVAVAVNGVRAVEHGTWTALKRNADGTTRYGGDYTAHWMRTPQGWRIKGELYVKLRCEGSLCTP